MIIVCSKCKAVNQYSKFIWTCPECGLHFRDKKSEINEIKIRKTKSSSRVNLLKGNFQEIDNDNYSTINNLLSSRKRSSLFDMLKKKKKENNNKDNKESFRFSTGFDFYFIYFGFFIPEMKTAFWTCPYKFTILIDSFTFRTH